MAVHASSVISTDIDDFDSALYTAITDKEEYAYDSGTNGGLTEFQPLFTTLSASIVAWMNEDRESNILDFIQGLYSYKIFADMYGSESSLLASSDAAALVDMDGYRGRIKTDAVTYYDDYPQVTFSLAGLTITRTSGSWVTEGFVDAMSVTVSGTVSNDGVYTVSASGVTALVLTVDEALANEGPIANVRVYNGTVAVMGSANMTTDIILIDAAFAGQETTDMATLTSGFSGTVSSRGFDLLFDTTSPLTTIGKDDMSVYIFDTLGYRTVFNNLNTGTLKSPRIFRNFTFNYDLTI